MAKGMNRGNKEVKKPKQPPKAAGAKPADLFAKGTQAGTGTTKTK